MAFKTGFYFGKACFKSRAVGYVSNIGALKHGLLGRIAEDNADLERANYHWQLCTKLLDDEAASATGAAQPRLNIDPFGTGGRSIMPNMF